MSLIWLKGKVRDVVRVASVNVNGVRASLRKGMVPWLDERRPELLALQEVRAPREILEKEFSDSWSIAQSVSEQKGRSGVALLGRSELTDVVEGLDDDSPTHTGRWIEATVESPLGPIRVVSVYVHSGEAGTPKMDDKFAFLDMMSARLAELASTYERVLVMGDINTAHSENDIKNWKGNLKSAGFLPEERAYLDRWSDAGWVDVHRALEGERPGPYTWWSMRGQAFDNDAGWRIDYHWATVALAKAAQTVTVDRAPSWGERWSDHAPLVVDYC